MGPPDLHAIMLQQKEQKDQIQKLILQLEASRSGNSHLRKRLLTTFDNLDYVQSELDTERKRNDKLMGERKAWKAKIKDAEATIDDMKEAVEMLIQKVELSNRDLTFWPRAQIYLPEPVAPSTSSKHSLEPIFLPHTDTLIQTIASERAAHTATLQELDIAEVKIAILNAQVARRDAELELCNFQIEAIQPTGSNPGSRTRDDGASNKVRLVMSSQEEVSRAIKVTAERNRALEIEIKALKECLEQARRSSRRTDVDHLMPVGLPSPSTASVAVQTAPQASSPEIKSVVTSRVKSQAVLDLEHDITVFAQLVDKFKEERALLSQALGINTHDAERNISERRDDFKTEALETDTHKVEGNIPERRDDYKTGPETKIPFKRVLVIEEECIRLKNLNETMKAELAELREENIGLRAELRARSMEGLYHVDPHHSNPQYENLPALGSVGFRPSPVVSENEKDMDISQTPGHTSTILPSGEDREEETDTLHGFTFLSFGTSGNNHSSVEVQPSEHSPYRLGPFDIGDPPIEADDSWGHIQGSGTAEEMARSVQSLSPSEVPLPSSAEE